MVDKKSKVVDCDICDDGSLLITFDHAIKPGMKMVTVTGEALYALSVDHARWPEPGESDFKNPIMTLEDVYETEEEGEGDEEEEDDFADSPTRPDQD
jgi:hypothetical protein